MKIRNTFAVVVTALVASSGLQLTRVLLATFVNYLRDSQGISALSLAPIALGVFFLSILAWPLWRLLGLRAALVVSAAGVALFRLAEQMTMEPSIDLYLASAGVVLFTTYLPFALGAVRDRGPAGTSQIALGLVLGVSLDTAIHIAGKTLDLSWQPGFWPTTAVLILTLTTAVLAFAWGNAGSFDRKEQGWPGSLALAAVGPWLFLQLVIFQNVARMGATTSSSLPLMALAAGIGNAIAVMSALHAPRARRFPGAVALLGILLVVLLAVIDTTGWLGLLFGVLGLAVSASLLATLFLGLGERAGGSGRLNITIANVLGQLLFVILTFAYYASYDISFGFRSSLILPLAGALFAGAAIAIRPSGSFSVKITYDSAAAVAAILLLIPALVLAVTWRQPQPVLPEAGNKTIRIVNYNLHNGFDTEGRLNLEEIAQVIEQGNPDIVGLQEVSRGWVIYSSADMLQWLAERLDMDVVFGPIEGTQWGVALLSRYPIVTAETFPLPPEDLLLRRGYTVAEINIGAEVITVINTHLHHIEEDSSIRQQQVPVLVEAWGGQPRTVLMGDLNAEPDSAEMGLLANSGLIDISAEIGPSPRNTYYSADPSKQIDYIWTSPDLIPQSFTIGRSTASDHLPLMATISLP